MLERIILIIDDNARIDQTYIPLYNFEIAKLKQKYPKWANYDFKLIHKTTMQEALEYMGHPQNVVDVLVVDYDFGQEYTFSNGTAFVKYIREHINRYCQIVFYTMQSIDSVDKHELIDLINSDVYKFVDKSGEHSKMAEIMFQAATTCNPIIESLERFMNEYSNMLQSYEHTFNGQKISLNEIINHIRMDDTIGRVFVEKLLQKGMLLSTDIGG